MCKKCAPFLICVKVCKKVCHHHYPYIVIFNGPNKHKQYLKVYCDGFLCVLYEVYPVELKNEVI
jgi:hypothetical protein